ncbi:hypothetical protein L6452_40131 [Arctium lappa]|uniref:Uncharacterized protein n=1 Tax=Arctium lappa TaxID=4217 RepID=A0ACB8XQ78_ARCLA|nr:hypothetical protein L6452_40131 [Arctium lappa]
MPGRPHGGDSRRRHPRLHDSVTLSLSVEDSEPRTLSPSLFRLKTRTLLSRKSKTFQSSLVFTLQSSSD